MRVLLTGATGFVGAHLHPRLAARGFEVIGGTRDPEKAQKRFVGRTFRAIDVHDEASVRAGLTGIDAAVYLVHSMADSADYARLESEAAERFARVAGEARVSRIVYLGGARPCGPASQHLQSRLQTGEILRAGPVPTLELQASMIIGAGSESFRMVRDLAARLPVMLLPRWLETKSQPIALDDVLVAIERSLELPLAASMACALPGPEVLSAREILERTSRMLGMDARMWGVPFVTPRLSSYWITLITRADVHVSRELVEGLRWDLVSADAGFWRMLPEHPLVPFDEAVRRALAGEEQGLSVRGRITERVLRRVCGHRAQEAPLMETRK
jgi:uncharacterized protein YbjT (DUF2867 family)